MYNQALTLFSLFDSVFSPNASTHAQHSYDTDAYETDDEIVINTDLPGYNKEDISVIHEDGFIVITGKSEDVKPRGKPLITRIGKKSYSKKYRLPDFVNGDSISASYDAGVLSLRLPKKEEERATKITVS